MSGEKVKAVWYHVARLTCRVFCSVFFRFRLYGMENIPEKGAFVLASNHQSFLDPVFCGCAVRRLLFYMARDSLFENLFFGPLLRSVNTIPVKRGKADIAAMKMIIKKLREGKGVCLFPEGTRTSDGRIADFKPGFGLLCRRGQAAIVPVLIDGAFECWPRHKKIFSPGAVSVWYGKAIIAEQVMNMDDRELSQVLTETLRQMQNECRIRNGKEPYEY